MSNVNPSKSVNDIFEAIEKESQKQSAYLKIQPGEIVKLQFDLDPDKIKLVNNEFDGKVTKRVEYRVIDLSTNEEKTLSMAISNARRIDNLLKRGKTTLEIERIGSGKGTIYNISAV